MTFHHVVVQLIFLPQRACRDIQLPVSCMTQRVNEPDRDDKGGLIRLLEYLNGTKHMKQTLEVDNLSTLHWFIDTLHQVHDDCKEHTGWGADPRKGVNDQYLKRTKSEHQEFNKNRKWGKDNILPQAL